MPQQELVKDPELRKLLPQAAQEEPVSAEDAELSPQSLTVKDPELLKLLPKQASANVAKPAKKKKGFVDWALDTATAPTVKAPYKFGGNDPDKGMDCSGYTCYVKGKEGVKLPRTAYEQFTKGQEISGKPQPGDLVFFDTGRNRRPDNQLPNGRHVTHVGVYLGDSKVRHQGSKGNQVDNIGALGTVIGFRRWGNPKKQPTQQPFAMPGSGAAKQQKPKAERDLVAEALKAGNFLEAGRLEQQRRLAEGERIKQSQRQKAAGKRTLQDVRREREAEEELQRSAKVTTDVYRDRELFPGMPQSVYDSATDFGRVPLPQTEAAQRARGTVGDPFYAFRQMGKGAAAIVGGTAGTLNPGGLTGIPEELREQYSRSFGGRYLGASQLAAEFLIPLPIVDKLVGKGLAKVLGLFKAVNRNPAAAVARMTSELGLEPNEAAAVASGVKSWRGDFKQLEREVLKPPKEIQAARLHTEAGHVPIAKGDGFEWVRPDEIPDDVLPDVAATLRGVASEVPGARAWSDAVERELSRRLDNLGAVESPVFPPAGKSAVDPDIEAVLEAGRPPEFRETFDVSQQTPGGTEAAGLPRPAETPETALPERQAWQTDISDLNGKPLGRLEAGHLNERYDGKTVQPNIAALTNGKPVFHETNTTNAKKLLKHLSGYHRTGANVWVTPDLDLALGQAGKGVIIEFDPYRVNGVVPSNLKNLIGEGMGGGANELVLDKTLTSAVRSITAKDARTLAALAKEPVLAKRFDFDNPVQTERGLKVVRKVKNVNLSEDAVSALDELGGTVAEGARRRTVYRTTEDKALYDVEGGRSIGSALDREPSPVRGSDSQGSVDVSGNPPGYAGTDWRGRPVLPYFVVRSSDDLSIEGFSRMHPYDMLDGDPPSSWWVARDEPWARAAVKRLGLEIDETATRGINEYEHDPSTFAGIYGEHPSRGGIDWANPRRKEHEDPLSYQDVWSKMQAQRSGVNPAVEVPNTSGKVDSEPQLRLILEGREVPSAVELASAEAVLKKAAAKFKGGKQTGAIDLGPVFNALKSMAKGSVAAGRFVADMVKRFGSWVKKLAHDAWHSVRGKSSKGVTGAEKVAVNRVAQGLWESGVRTEWELKRELRELLLLKGRNDLVKALDHMWPEVIKHVKANANDAVSQLSRLVKDAKPAREETAALQAQGRKEQARRVGAALDRGKGEQALNKGLKAAQGDLPAADFTPPLQHLPQAEQDELRQSLIELVLRHPELSGKPLSKLRLGNAMRGLLNGVIPTDGEIRAFGQLFGSDFMGAIAGKRPLRTRALNTVIDVYHAPKSLMGSWDDSSVLRQAAILTWAHPGKAVKAAWSSLRAFANEDYAQLVMRDMEGRDLYGVMESSGLYIAPLNDTLDLLEREEYFTSRLISKVPGIRPSERAFVTYLNTIRADAFESMWHSTAALKKLAHTLGADVPEDFSISAREGAAIADFINAATGRASLGKLEKAAGALSTVLWSPRLTLSRFTAPAQLLKGSAYTRLVASAEFAKWLGGVATVMYLAEKAGAKVTWDHRSSDFGKIVIGKTRVSFLGGFEQSARLVLQQLSGETKDKDGKVKKSDRDQLLLRYGRIKAHPVAGAIYSSLKGQKVTGEPTTAFAMVDQDIKFGGKKVARVPFKLPAGEIPSLLLPLNFDATAEILAEHGLLPLGAPLELFSTFGASTAVHDRDAYEPDSGKPSRPRRPSRREMYGVSE